MMENLNVQIVLATYNGERFLRQQLESILLQSYQNFKVLIRDDGSTDNTIHILLEYQNKYPEKFKLDTSNNKNLGATQNFAFLLSKTQADYIFFCDQDDIWLKDKVEKSLQKILEIENNNNSIPCLVFSDMKWIDEQNNVIFESVWKRMHLSPRVFSLNRLLIQNIPHGCTMVINKAMRNLACPIPNDAILHDHWIALLAVCCGKFDYLTEPGVLLRYHDKSVTRKLLTFSEKLKKYFDNLKSGREYEYYIKIRVNQAKALQIRASSFIQEEQYVLLQQFILLENTSGVRRKKIFIKNQFYRTTFWHTFKMIFRA